MRSNRSTTISLNLNSASILFETSCSIFISSFDRGSQYCSNDYQKLLKDNSFICSMSRKGNCWDNAPMESFWGKLKQEWLNDQHFKTREEAKAAIFWYIEAYYRRKRTHATNGYRTPEVYTASAANF